MSAFLPYRVLLPSRSYLVGNQGSYPEGSVLLNDIVFGRGLDIVCFGWCQYEGPLPGGEADDLWLGVSWDYENAEDRGTRADGSYNGVFLFEAWSTSVSFLRKSKLPEWVFGGFSVLESVAVRYLSVTQSTAGIKCRASRELDSRPNAYVDPLTASLVVPRSSGLWGTEGPAFEVVGVQEGERYYKEEDIDKLASMDLSSGLIGRVRSPCTKSPDESKCSISKGVQHLDLSFNKLLFSWEEIGCLRELFPTLQSVALCGCRALLHAAARLPLKNYTFRGFRAIQLASVVRSQAEFEGLKRALVPFSDLEELHLGDNELNDEQIEELVGCLPKTTLKALNLSGNRMSSIIRLFASLLQLSGLTLLQCNDNPFVWECYCVLESPLELQFLNVDRCNIEEWSAVYTLAVTFPKLTTLRIGANPFMASVREDPELCTRSRYVIIALFPYLQSLDGELITAKRRLEAERYTISLIRRRLFFAELFERGDESGRRRDARLERLLSDLCSRHDQSLADIMSSMESESDVNRRAEKVFALASLPPPTSPLPELVKLAFSQPLDLALFVITIEETRCKLRRYLVPSLTSVESLKREVAMASGCHALAECVAFWEAPKLPAESDGPPSDLVAKYCWQSEYQGSSRILLEPDYNLLDYFGLVGVDTDLPVYDLTLSSAKRESHSQEARYLTFMEHASEHWSRLHSQ